jgi:GntR family transcriptional regulator
VAPTRSRTNENPPDTVRQTRYQTIADTLRTRITDGELPAGRLLPSEADLSGDFNASRVTIRRALEVLRTEGLVDSRQGLGWFVAADPLRQSLAQLGTIESQLATEGVASTRQILDFRFGPAPTRVRDTLGCDTVLRVRRLNLANDHPFAVVTVWCPEHLGASLSRTDVERSPFYELIDVELGGAVQTIAAGAAGAADAELLQIPPGAPVLRCERITSSLDGRPVLVSEHVFPGHLTEFVVHLPRAQPSMAPSGLRLVD